MKLAVLADIHANYVALQAVAAHIQAWQPDAVIVAGDVINRGPRPAECLHFVLEKEKTEGWRLVRGNHEDYVIDQARPEAPLSGPVFEVHRASYWTYQKLGRDISALEAMPFQQSLLTPDGREARTVHASMLGNRDGIYPTTSDAELALKVRGQDGQTDPLSPALFCVGHTHYSLVRRLNDTLVVNAGSAGLPFDGDNLPAYAQLTWIQNEWQARIARVDYDLPLAERELVESGYMDEAGPLAQLVQVELRTAHPQLGSWANRYQAQALQGQISMEESVRRFLGN